MAASFRQLWDRLHFARLVGDLVSVPAAIRRVIFDGLRRDARSCARGDRTGERSRQSGTQALGAPGSVSPNSAIACRHSGVAVVLVFSERARSSIRCGI